MSRALEKMRVQAEQVIGRPVTQYAPVLRKRESMKWAGIAGIAVGILVGVLLGSVGVGGALRGGLVGLCVAGGFALRNEPRGLALIDDGLVLVAGDAVFGRPQTVVGAVDPAQVQWGDSGFFGGKATIHGEAYSVNRRFIDPAQQIVATALAAATAEAPPAPAPGTPPPAPPDFSARDAQPGADEG